MQARCSRARRSWTRYGTRTGSVRRRRSTFTSPGSARRSRTTPRNLGTSRRSAASAFGSSHPTRRRRAPTKVRTRLVLAFTYVLVVMLIALGVPLTITLQQRAAAELEREALIETQGIAAAIDPDDVDDPEKLQPLVDQAAAQVGGRVIVVDEDGVLTADSEGPEEQGTFFATPGRPEIEIALGGEPHSEIRDSQDLSEDIMATAVPIPEENRIVGAVRVTRS